MVLIELHHRFLVRFGLQFPLVLKESHCNSRARFRFAADVWILRFAVQRVLTWSLGAPAPLAAGSPAARFRVLRHRRLGIDSKMPTPT